MNEKGEITDFILDLRDAILKDIPTNPDWAESIATNVLNAVVGEHICTTTQIGELNTNLIFTEIGPSGLANKTTPLKYFAHPILSRFKEITGIDLFRCSRFTIEAMIKEFAENPRGIIIRDEFSSVFKEANKGYIGDILEFISEIYDGTTQKRITKSGGLDFVKDIHISILTATTPYIYSVMDTKFFVQGTGNRMLFTISDQIEPKKIDKNFEYPANIIERTERIDIFVNKLVDIFNNFKDGKFNGVIMSNKLIDFKNEMSIACSEATKKDNDTDARYFSRMAEMAYKLATVKGVSHENAHPIPYEGFKGYPITADDVDWAIAKTKRHILYYQKMCSQWKIVPDSYKFKTDVEAMDYLKQVLQIAGRPLTTAEFSKASHMFWKRFTEITRTMLANGDIVRVDGKGKEVLYTIKSILSTMIASGEIVQLDIEGKETSYVLKPKS